MAYNGIGSASTKYLRMASSYEQGISIKKSVSSGRKFSHSFNRTFLFIPSRYHYQCDGEKKF
jgi:hypothetical protein